MARTVETDPTTKMPRSFPVSKKTLLAVVMHQGTAVSKGIGMFRSQRGNNTCPSSNI